MLKSRDDLLKEFGDLMGERNDDAAISFMENLSDSVGNNSAGDIEVLKAEIEKERAAREALDAEWRNRYKERFMDGPKVETKIETEARTTENADERAATVTIDDVLYEERKGE